MQSGLQLRQYHAFHPGSSYQIVTAGGRPIGRLLLDRGAAVIRVVDVALLPEYRDRGVGGSLMRSVLDEADRAGLPVRLHVDLANPALRLYQRLGFSPVAHHGLSLEMERLPPGRTPDA